jgi:hypothetical protein
LQMELEEANLVPKSGKKDDPVARLEREQLFSEQNDPLHETATDTKSKSKRERVDSRVLGDIVRSTNNNASPTEDTYYNSEYDDVYDGATEVGSRYDGNEGKPADSNYYDPEEEAEFGRRESIGAQSQIFDQMMERIIRMADQQVSQAARNRPPTHYSYPSEPDHDDGPDPEDYELDDEIDSLKSRLLEAMRIRDGDAYYQDEDAWQDMTEKEVKTQLEKEAAEKERQQRAKQEINAIEEEKGQEREAEHKADVLGELTAHNTAQPTRMEAQDTASIYSQDTFEEVSLSDKGKSRARSEYTVGDHLDEKFGESKGWWNDLAEYFAAPQPDPEAAVVKDDFEQGSSTGSTRSSKGISRWLYKNQDDNQR